MSTEIKRSCKNCFCKGVCTPLQHAVTAFQNAARSYISSLREEIHTAIDVSLAKECINFSSVDDQDFKRLEAENKRLQGLLDTVKEKLR